MSPSVGLGWPGGSFREGRLGWGAMPVEALEASLDERSRVWTGWPGFMENGDSKTGESPDDFSGGVGGLDSPEELAPLPEDVSKAWKEPR